MLNQSKPRDGRRIGHPEVFRDIDVEAEWKVLRLHSDRGVDLEDPESPQPQGPASMRIAVLFLLILRGH
jgi:hypothetical protein